jgi:hypothetical protein
MPAKAGSYVIIQSAFHQDEYIQNSAIFKENAEKTGQFHI